MATPANSALRIAPNTSVVSLTTVQEALWHLGLPILDAKAVAQHKKRAKLGMLWRGICWPVAGVALLITFESLGRHWGRVAVVGGAGTMLMGLFAWLLSASDLIWETMDYGAFRKTVSAPSHVSAAAEALVDCGVSESQIGVEYLKSDPILFVLDPVAGSEAKRYDLIIW